MLSSKLINIGAKVLRNKNILSYRIDSEIILSYIMNIPREKLLISENNVPAKNIREFKILISRRLRDEPIAYILNKKEFRSENFFVNNNSLIPRPETELLIDPIIKFFKRKNLYFLDIGVGTGCIMLSILKELKHSRGIGVDSYAGLLKNFRIKNLI